MRINFISSFETHRREWSTLLVVLILRKW